MSMLIISISLLFMDLTEILMLQQPDIFSNVQDHYSRLNSRMGQLRLQQRTPPLDHNCMFNAISDQVLIPLFLEAPFVSCWFPAEAKSGIAQDYS